MSKPYLRGDSKFWWFAFTDAQGKRQQVSSETTDEEEAKGILAAVKRRVKAEKESGLAKEGPLTVRKYAQRWIEERKARGVASAADDETRLKHALPTIGAMKLSEVRPKDLRTLVRSLWSAGKLSPRSIHHVYGILRVMFADAVVEELIATTPAVLARRRGELPKKQDKDPTWRATALYERHEIEALISDPRIPERRRVLYGIEFLCGVRVNEVTPRVWADYDPAAEPLGRLLFATAFSRKQKKVKETKTGKARPVPVHPTLAKLLAHWKLTGWREAFGRNPEPGDLLLPGPKGTRMDSAWALELMHRDLELLGLRKRRQHDCRRTFITLGQVDGARREVLEVITHDEKGDVTSLYTSFPWPARCEAVSKLNIHLLEGRVVPLAATGGATAMLRQSEGVEMKHENECPGRDSNSRSFSSGSFLQNVGPQEVSGFGAGGTQENSGDASDRSNVATDYEKLGVLLGFKVTTPGGGGQ